MIFIEKEQRCFVTLEIIFQGYSQEDTLFRKEGFLFFFFFRGGNVFRNS